MMLHRISLFVLLAALWGCGADLSTDSDHGGGVLLLSETSADRLTGTFERDGATVRFTSSRSGAATHLAISSAAGEPLAVSDNDGTTSTLSLLGGRLQYRGPASGDGAPPSMDMIGDGQALADLVGRPDARVLPWLSQELGARGISGRSHPASFALHGLAHFVADQGGIELPPLSPRMSAEADAAATASRCQDLRKDPKHDGCYGMCGKGCGCWSWVCGDCCWHKGCANHDKACRSCGITNPGACAACGSFSAFFTGGGC